MGAPRGANFSDRGFNMAQYIGVTSSGKLLLKDEESVSRHLLNEEREREHLSNEREEAKALFDFRESQRSQQAKEAGEDFEPAEFDDSRFQFRSSIRFYPITIKDSLSAPIIGQKPASVKVERVTKEVEEVTLT